VAHANRAICTNAPCRAAFRPTPTDRQPSPEILRLRQYRAQFPRLTRAEHVAAARLSGAQFDAHLDTMKARSRAWDALRLQGVQA
jgi:negative regulator of sigma E activity